ncbi:ATP-binding protein [Streptomyces spectabilis]|uniref:ATP-binding protein n=2 Tax=Streptomyces spectabilis TaxID=68270 RepID=A0A5P2XMU0_STRST|nr:ATP-binding protein [Streptomyces spectabilis]MBB5102563.1 anti-sigma regulatory factor (Ser/Thr protein kinase) [Streptomyces spectabilis]MCI3907603.1 ATP-binding protein [Streptomyces spectabilis]QEV64290.1 ATP-binding protein [Streptomyces spectabilis]
MITAQYERRSRTGTAAIPATPPAPPGPAAAHRESLATLAATAEAAPALRRSATASARAWHLDAATCEALALVVTELVTNVILHSGSPRVTLRLRLLPGVLRAEVHDTGCWHRRVTRRRAAATDGATADPLRAESGRGLALVEAYADHTTIRPSRTGTTVLAEFALR